MSATSASILESLKAVETERSHRLTVRELRPKVASLKAYQQRRFSHTYADLLLSARYGPAARFFLDELYGPTDFTRRDAQFARVVPALVRLFPREIVLTVAALAELHALSEGLDTEMAAKLDAAQPVTAMAYVRAWQRTGRAPGRQRQVALTLDIAQRLDRFTRKPLLHNSLRLMRGPAQASGLAELQEFLEAGFDTFRAMGGAEEFVAIVESREQSLASALFSADINDSGKRSSLHLALATLPD